MHCELRGFEDNLIWPRIFPRRAACGVRPEGFAENLRFGKIDQPSSRDCGFSRNAAFGRRRQLVRLLGAAADRLRQTPWRRVRPKQDIRRARDERARREVRVRA
jgi:hypothetical protein